jgi:hypothetical protein
MIFILHRGLVLSGEPQDVYRKCELSSRLHLHEDWGPSPGRKIDGREIDETGQISELHELGLDTPCHV